MQYWHATDTAQPEFCDHRPGDIKFYPWYAETRCKLQQSIQSAMSNAALISIHAALTTD